MNKALKYFVAYLSLTCLSEGMAILLSIVIKNSLIVYHIYTPIQFFLISLYFNYSIELFKKKNIGFIIGLSGILISVVNSFFFQQPSVELNTNFLIIESLMIIGMSLFSFYELIDSDIINVHFEIKFWLTALLLTFWSFTFFYWLIGNALYNTAPNEKSWISLLDLMIWMINIIIYSGFGIVFLSYRKMHKV